MSNRTRSLFVALGILAAAPSAASAATVTTANVDQIGGRMVVVTAAPGEANQLVLAHGTAPGTVIIRDDGSSRLFESSPDCVVLNAQEPQLQREIQCTTRVRAEIYAGDQNDTVDVQWQQTTSQFGPDFPHVVTDLGDGDDRYTAQASATGKDFVTAGAGNDHVSTGGGYDEVTAGDGNDVVFGGVHGDIIWGGLGHDRMDGQQGSDEVHGEAGDDVIGPLLAQPQRFCPPPTLANPRPVCTVTHFQSDPAGDFQAYDIVTGGAGNDLLSTRDSAIDAPISCGTGTDTAEIDSDESNPSACETVRREA